MIKTIRGQGAGLFASPIALGLLLVLVPFGRMRKRNVQLLAVLALVASGMLSGCGGSGAGKTGGNSQTYAITVQAISGSLSHTVALNLTVTQP